MGVNGLTTYLRNNRVAIEKNVELRKHDQDDIERKERIETIHIVVDGWS